MTTLQSHLHSLSIVTCSTGLPHRFAAYRLSFPLQTRVCQTHAWGWCFYSTTWRVRVSLTGTLSCQGSKTLPLIPRFTPVSSERVAHTACTGQVRARPALAGKAAPTADSASGGFFCQVPPLPVTPAVGRLKSHRKIPKEIL